MSNIIDKIQLSGVTYDLPSGGSGSTTVELTQAEYDALVSGGTVDPDTFYIITDATPQDMSQYWTSAQTNSAITQAVSGKADSSAVTQEISAAVSGKQDTLISGTNIKTINNESILGNGNIDIQGGGGGKAVSGGTNISITTGETADTINCTLPITVGGSFNGSINLSGKRADNVMQGDNQVVQGAGTKAANNREMSIGAFNVSNKANNTWGDSGNTLFSVGNGTADNARHNAFEIRQNGDIYITSGETDIKLQDHLGGGASYSAGTNIGITNNVISCTIPENRLNLLYGYATSGNTDIFSWATGSTSQYIDGYISFAKINNTRIVGSNISPVSNFSLVETSAITTNITSSSTDSEVPSAKAVYDALQEGGGGGGGMTEDDELLLATALTDLNDRKIDASDVKSNYQKKGDYVTTNTLNTRLAEYETALDEQNVEEVTAYALNDLNNRVTDNTTALGGMKLVKITESEYAALTTKDENTLYIVVADPS